MPRIKEFPIAQLGIPALVTINMGFLWLWILRNLVPKS